MKKIFILFIVILSVFLIQNIARATNIMPRYVSLKYTDTLGLYQVRDKITLYKEPSEKSPVVTSFTWSGDKIFPENANFEDLFVVYIPSKELALMAVSDETEDWVQVIYNNKTGKKAWLKKDDPYKFMTWVNFFDSYGRKYGLYMLQSAPESVNEIMSSDSEEDAKNIGELNHPEIINLNVIRGNWALVSVMDLDRQPKTGFIRWRSDDGIKYFFPDIK